MYRYGVMDTRPSLLARLGQAVFYGPTEGLSRKKRDQIFALNVYALLGWIALTVFGVLHVFVEQNELIGQFEVLLAGVIVLNAVGLRLTRDITVTRTVFLLTILIAMIMLLITGGTQNTGVFWLFTYPVLAFFLAGKREGAWWSIGLGVLVVGTLFLHQLSFIDIPYSFVALRQLLASLLVVSIGIYIYQGARERAATELADNQRDLQEYLDHMSTLNLKIGPGGSILFANKSARDSSGLGEKLVGTNFLECALWCFDKSVRRRVEAAFYKALSGQPVNYDEQIKIATPSGDRIVTANFSLLPIARKNKRIKYILVEARDISAEQQVDQAKSEFVALASERLGDPLLAISSAADRLINSTRLQPDQLKEMQRIYKSSQNMAALIDDMLLVAKLELANLPLSSNQSSPAKLVDEVINEIQLVRRKPEISREYQDELPNMPLDTFVFQKIMHNLVTNAAIYTSDDGHVYVRLNKIDEKLYPESKGSLQIVVQDDGRGIPEADQTRVFTKFFRASNSSAQETSGTGLGLYIVKSLVDYVGGSIAFRSEENVGTTFIITLPIEGMPSKQRH